MKQILVEQHQFLAAKTSLRPSLSFAWQAKKIKWSNQRAKTVWSASAMSHDEKRPTWYEKTNHFPCYWQNSTFLAFGEWKYSRRIRLHVFFFKIMTAAMYNDDCNWISIEIFANETAMIMRMIFCTTFIKSSSLFLFPSSLSMLYIVHSLVTSVSFLNCPIWQSRDARVNFDKRRKGERRKPKSSSSCAEGVPLSLVLLAFPKRKESGNLEEKSRPYFAFFSHFWSPKKKNF